ncbi:hypothetical protein AYO36_00885 [Exiguobacterium sp. KKBO11]|nr:hypothetical protein AYO36_00885 [Exiguobacterium sp. KKBO11]
MLKMYRFSHKLYKMNIPIVPKVVFSLIRIIFSAEIPYTCTLQKNVELKHGGLGVVIHPKSIIGEGTVIYQNVTIGGRENRGYPIIGENVYIGAGACILGGIKIGDNVKIGANAVVVKSVPNDTTVGGIPAQKIK